MDRNSVIGLILIGAILVAYSIFSSPSKEEREALIRRQDSLALVSQKQAMQEQNNRLNASGISGMDQNIKDSSRNKQMKDQFGVFSSATSGKNEFYTIENDLLKLTISSKGGRIYSAQVKKYKTYDSLPLILFNGDTNVFALNFFAQNRNISTQDLYFKPVGDAKSLIVSDQPGTLAMRLYVDSTSYLEFKYTVLPGSYMINFDISMSGMNKYIAANTNYLTLTWDAIMPRLEKGISWERNNSGVYFKYYEDVVDYLSETKKEDEKNISTRINWIAYKQQFFSTALIAPDAMLNAAIKTSTIEGNETHIRRCFAEIGLPYQNASNETIALNFYFGPNRFKTLKSFNLDLQRMIPLGWGIFGWVNRFVVIPLFNWLGNFIDSFGLIILLMTIIIKLALFPLTYKSYLSTAKMKILKPQVDEINARYPKSEDAMKKQQAVMAMYKKAGVNPLGGCLPMLLQLPILIAMFRFFPASIELRHESFLWAADLSTYDSILDLPFNIPYFGSHVSLFCLLMTLANYIYIVVGDQANMGGSTQMPGMKFMMYFMPVMMLFWFNSYASGLSYYYFLSLMLTIAQTLIIRSFVDDEAILAKIAANEKKPVKKSNFQKKMEEVAKKRGYNLKR